MWQDPNFVFVHFNSVHFSTLLRNAFNTCYTPNLWVKDIGYENLYKCYCQWLAETTDFSWVPPRYPSKKTAV